MVINHAPLLAGGNIRRGQHICGCDSRRGTITVKCLDMTVLIVVIIVLTFSYKDLDKTNQNEEQIEHINTYYLWSMILYGASLAMAVLVIFGAWLYNRRLVVTGMVWIVIELILTLVFCAPLFNSMGRNVLHTFYIIGPIVWTAIQMYPQAVYIHEVNSGTMSPLTYDREARCCCCI